MAEVPNIFQSRVPAGKISGEALTILGEPVRTHAVLSRGIAASQINLLDSVDISQAAQVAQEISAKNASLTGSSNGPSGIPPAHPIINGIANIKQATQQLASGK